MPACCTRFRCRSLLLAVALVMVSVPAAAGCVARSGAQVLPLVELYTSEGCDSCPPADRWFTSAFASGGPVRATALAFHVDYWDRLGWKDRFATPAWTERQYAAMRAGHAAFVFTPQVLLQGRDFGWRDGRLAPAVDAAAARPARATIALAATARSGAIAVAVTATVAAPADREGTAVELVYVDGGLVSDVRAGENAGTRLAHDHVVRALVRGPAFDAAGEARGNVALPVPAERGTLPAVVALVRNAATGEVLQTLALPLDGEACAPAR